MHWRSETGNYALMEQQDMFSNWATKPTRCDHYFHCSIINKMISNASSSMSSCVYCSFLHEGAVQDYQKINQLSSYAQWQIQVCKQVDLIKIMYYIYYYQHFFFFFLVSCRPYSLIYDIHLKGFTHRKHCQIPGIWQRKGLNCPKWQ